jgi:hypothetical protein
MNARHDRKKRFIIYAASLLLTGLSHFYDVRKIGEILLWTGKEKQNKKISLCEWRKANVSLFLFCLWSNCCAYAEKLKTEIK